MATMTRRPIAIDWSIKGYHAFRVNPHVEITMKLIPEPNNQYDRNAFSVLMPTLNEIPRNMHSQATRNGQTVSDIAGRQVGHVPANLCRVFSKLNTQGLASDLQCKYLGTLTGSATLDHFQAGIRRDRPGGGPELHCRYQLTVPANRFRTVMLIFEEFLTHNELERIHC